MSGKKRKSGKDRRGFRWAPPEGVSDGDRNFCAVCGGGIQFSKNARRWLHDETPWNPPHQAEPSASGSRQ